MIVKCCLILGDSERAHEYVYDCVSLSHCLLAYDPPSQGLVVVWELHLERRGRPERACTSWEHRGQTLTALCWDTAALRVFAGDAGGKVSSVRAGSSKLGKVLHADGAGAAGNQPAETDPYGSRVCI